MMEGQYVVPGAAIPPRLVAPPEPPRVHMTTREHRAELETRLREVATALARTYNATVARIEHDMPGVEPFDVTTPDGAPMLAPMLAALGNVYAALAALEGR